VSTKSRAAKTSRKEGRTFWTFQFADDPFDVLEALGIDRTRISKALKSGDISLHID